jgi:hypothetical protein
LAHFIRVIDGVAAEVGSPLSSGSPDLADEIIARSDLLRRLGEKYPELVAQPIVRSQQLWVASARPSHLPRRSFSPARAQFVDASSVPVAPSTKPFGLGLYTSTRVSRIAPWGMWGVYLQINRNSTLYPFPRSTWALCCEKTARVAEITSASEWSQLVVDNAFIADNHVVYPDWRAIAKAWDGVHLTIRAVAAIEGISFSSAVGLLAPAYWGIESTLWLRWVFEGAKLLKEELDANDSSAADVGDKSLLRAASSRKTASSRCSGSAEVDRATSSEPRTEAPF